MGLNDDMEHLSLVPLFEGLDREQLRLVAFGAEHQRVRQGEVLFEEGDPADCAYVVVQGRIELSRKDRSGRRSIEAVAEAGAMLSELALMTATDRKYHARALADAELIRIGRPLFHRLIQEYPDMAATVEARIRETIARLADSLAPLEARFR